MSTADRLIELAVRNDVELDIPAYKEAAQAIKNELIAEPSEEPTYDDIVFNESEQAAQKADLGEDEDTHEVDDEGEERLREKFVPLYAIIGQLTVTQKIRRAMLGTAAERLLLVRDSNRLVAAAAVKSPLMRDNEAVQISASRAVSEDVLRAIAQKTEFIRNYQVKVNLVSNPRTPFAFSSRFVQHLRDNDIRKEQERARGHRARGKAAHAAKTGQDLARRASYGAHSAGAARREPPRLPSAASRAARVSSACFTFSGSTKNGATRSLRSNCALYFCASSRVLNGPMRTRCHKPRSGT
jgi:hypothetical protein